MRDRRHEPADFRRRDGASLRGRCARGVLRGGADEEESPRHPTDRDRATRTAEHDRRRHLPRNDHNRAALFGGRSRGAGTRDRHRENADRRCPLQGGAPRRTGHQRDARIRRLREAGRGAQSVGERRAGHRDPGVPSMSRFYITTAIDFVNSVPHLGTAYEKIYASVIARHKRLAGFDRRFQMGNDEHSQNVFRKAQEEGLDPVAYCDKMEGLFRRAWGHLEVSFDDFIRTTQPRHAVGVTEIVNRLYAAGDIYEGVYEGWYCQSCE